MEQVLQSDTSQVYPADHKEDKALKGLVIGSIIFAIMNMLVSTIKFCNDYNAKADRIMKLIALTLIELGIFIGNLYLSYIILGLNKIEINSKDLRPDIGLLTVSEGFVSSSELRQFLIGMGCLLFLKSLNKYTLIKFNTRLSVNFFSFFNVALVISIISGGLVYLLIIFNNQYTGLVDYSLVDLISYKEEEIL